MYQWTEERVLWYQRAVAYTGFDRKLLEWLTPYLPREESVCDLGCGTGYLALELARQGYSVTAVDRSGVCMERLRERRRLQGLENLELWEADWQNLMPGTQWDNVLMVFAGRLDQEIEYYLSLSGKRLILVVKTSRQSHVQAKGTLPLYRRDAGQLEEDIRSLKLKYTRLDGALEFGQPLCSREEARQYLAAFQVDADQPDGALERLVETGDPDYPLYLPGSKELAAFIIEK